MKALRLLFFVFLVSCPLSFSFGIGGIRIKSSAAQSKKASKAHDCSERTNTLSQQTKTLKELTQNIAWYQDRDNSMKDIDINEDSVDGEVGRAMATFIGRSTTQGIQVCPGVFLTTAHGNLDDPRDADCSKPINPSKPSKPCKQRSVKKPSKHFKAGFHYPISKKTLLKASTDQQFISPRLRDPKKWNDKASDYVFIKVDQAVRPNDFIEPVRTTSDEIVQASKNGVETYLYRGKTRFNEDSNGVPDFNKKNIKNKFKDILKVYQKPQKVNEKCKLAERELEGLTVSDCPTESNVSGSSMITTINDKPYLLGLHALGHNKKISNFKNGEDLGASFINSSEFCADYQKACNTPCSSINTTLSQQNEESI